jgi:thiamine biosynthesis protein ThiC
MEKEACSMCGNLCAIKIVKDYLKDNDSDIESNNKTDNETES